ncbi:hypothetical protein PVBG_05956 [Plasmodium vivax Brazil I]|uniref:Variable surface protein Vir18 n=1 Tax=Plasmodium vivax (strain Brazil I) TaxID=1033975 RepID=A0A0J9VNU7_PLAV1|nr:hypothetical protein PVBG_05956 [Plasmodium vivax Brazil I]
MAHRNQQYRSVLSKFRQFNDNTCINDFVNFKNEIDQKISELSKKSPSVFCRECVKIKESIIEKDKKFKNCYIGGSKQLNLIENNVDIKSFIDECTIFTQCVHKRSARNRPVPLKSTNTDRCEKDSRCNNGKPPTRGAGSKKQPKLATETSRTEISQRQKSQTTREKQAEGKDSKEQRIDSKTPQIAITLPNPVKTQREVSESLNNNQPITSAQVETPISPSAVSCHKSTTELEKHATSPRPLSISGHESDSDIPVQQSHINKDPIPNNSPDDQSYGNSPSERDTAAQIDVRQDRAEQAALTEIPYSAIHADKTKLFRGPDDKNFAQADPSTAKANGLEPASAEAGNVAATHLRNESTHLDNAVIDANNSDDEVDGKAVDHDNTISRDTGIKNSVSESSEESYTIRGNTSSGGSDHTEVSNNNNASNETHSNASSCSVTPCSNEQGTEINAPNSEKPGIFDQFSNIILNNQRHMINASIPMGIVLLFSLLFKVKQNLLHQSNYLCYFIYI